MIFLLYIPLLAEAESVSILVQYGALGVLTFGAAWMYFNERKERIKIQDATEVKIQLILDQRDKSIAEIKKQKDALQDSLMLNKKEYEDTLKNIFQELKNL